MISDFLFSGQKLNLVKRSMDAAMLRHGVISNNIANVNTPNFKKQEVVFEETLAKAMDATGFHGKTTHPRHIQIGSGALGAVTPKLVVNGRTSMRNDGNNVDIDEEMATLSKNTINYRALSSALDGELTKINQAITKLARA